jgi:hypothetical protein
MSVFANACSPPFLLQVIELRRGTCWASSPARAPGAFAQVVHLVRGSQAQPDAAAVRMWDCRSLPGRSPVLAILRIHGGSTGALIAA